MKIAILTSGILPVPAVQGGAVENLIDFYLDFNNRHRLHDITVYSVKHPDTRHHPALKSAVNHYRYIDMSSPLARIRKRIYLKLRGGGEPLHYAIEYFLEQALRHLRRQAYDIIILENRPAYALKLRNVTNARLVYHIHNEKLTNDTAFSKEIYESATTIICVSDYIRHRVQTINPADRKCVTVHNGIDLSAFSRHGMTGPTRQQLNLSENDFVLLFSGRINAEKGILQLIRAISRLDSYPQIKLLILGSPFYGADTTEDRFYNSLQEASAPLKDRILFTGFIPYSQMPAYLRLADVAVIPSVWDDPFPTTVLEAQAMALPIITTRRGGIPEEVTEQNAILLDTDEHFIDHLADAILHLYQHPERRRAMSEASSARSRSFDKDTYAKTFFECLSKL